MNTVYSPGGPIVKELDDFLRSDICPVAEYPIQVRHSHGDEKHIFFMTEQLLDIVNDDTIFFYNTLKRDAVHEIWTFSDYNVHIMNNAGITKARLIKLEPSDEYREQIISYNPDNTYDYDVCFFGWMRERRYNMIHQLQIRGLRVTFGQDHWGETRDRIIAKSKVMVNVHYAEDFKCFEQIRCFPWMCTGKIVVSETSYDTDERVIFADYDKLSDTVAEVIRTRF
jgi:hypothetical protein